MKRVRYSISQLATIPKEVEYHPHFSIIYIFMKWSFGMTYRWNKQRTYLVLIEVTKIWFLFVIASKGYVYISMLHWLHKNWFYTLLLITMKYKEITVSTLYFIQMKFFKLKKQHNMYSKVKKKIDKVSKNRYVSWNKIEKKNQLFKIKLPNKKS